MRDSKGRFLPGHKPFNPRDATTGRFIKSVKGKVPEPTSLEDKVDRLLSSLMILVGGC